MKLKLYILFILFLINISFALQIESNFPLPQNNIKEFYINEKNKEILINALKSTGSFEKIELKENKLILKRKYLIKKIHLKGNKSFWKKELIGIAGIYEGQYISDKDIYSILLKLRQFYINNGFLDVNVKIKTSFKNNGNIDIHIHINEGKRKYIKNVKFISDIILSKEEEKRYKKILNLENKPLNFSLIEKSFRNLASYLQKKGYFDTYIYLHSIYNHKKEKNLAIVNIIHGTYYKIKFIGNYSFNEKILKKLYTFIEDGVNLYSTEKFANKIKEFYKKNGFLDADVDFLIEENISKKETVIKIFIYEGKPYKVNNIRISSDTNIPKKLHEFLKSFKGRIYKKVEIENRLRKLMNHYIKNGYINSYYVIKDKKAENYSVDLYIEIFKGKKYLLSEVKFEGYTFKNTIDTPILYKPEIIIRKKLEYEKYLKSLGYFDSKVEFKVKTKSYKNKVKVSVIYITYLGKRYKNAIPFIYGTWQLKPKAISWILDKDKGFDKDKYDNELNTLYTSYLFKFLNPTLILDKKNKKVIKAISVVEEKRGNIQGSLAYNSVEKFKGSVSLALRNLFNYGFEINSYVELSQINTNYRVSFGDRLLPKKFQSFIGAYSSYQYHRYYDLLNSGFDINISRNANKWVIQRWKIDFSNNKVKPSNYFYKKYTFLFSLSDDHRNNKIYPTSGYYFRGSTGYITGDVVYPFVDLSFRYYYKIPFTEKFIFTQRTYFGAKFKSLEKLPLSERYFIGGIFTIRGFAYEEVSNYGDGGNSFIVLNNELRFPILSKYSLYGFSFIDLGNVYGNKKTLEKLYLRKTTGFGLMVPTPAGSFMFGISTVLDRKQNEDKYRIEFSISAIF